MRSAGLFGPAGRRRLQRQVAFEVGAGLGAAAQAFERDGQVEVRVGEVGLGLQHAAELGHRQLRSPASRMRLARLKRASG